MIKTAHTYSQLGQDLLIKKKFKRANFGEWYCVDVGCHHPIINNNTFLFYELGARVLNIDPNPDLEGLYKRYRGEDKFLCSAVSNAPSTQKYYRYSNSQWNGLEENLGQKSKLVSTEFVPVSSLQTIFVEHNVPETIDFLSIDTEGHELRVLQGVDLNKYDIGCICLESRMNAENHLNTELHKFLTDRYVLFAHNGHDALYIKRK
ncbi:FkbM family methyltransferase [Labrenzia sp. VG12]|uniref:FkbM family methyltransferase n=1 Tax=Labrenzia sp. VG12 TaxID=2021862 RepID=UPI000B8BC337|nr:FkbM family methyltransferase [Labrenzia sp. VG12]ASP35870.1 hypothetical protein CHH27_23655 [Labrenzia sp. VG12]